MGQILIDCHIADFGVIWSVALILAIWALRWRKKSALPVKFWQIQGILQVAVLLQAVLGVSLLALGMRPKDPLHELYGVLTVLVVLAERGFMPHGRLREGIAADWGRFSEPWVYVIANFLMLALASRAATTGFWGF